MGGVDKGLQLLRGQPLAMHAFMRVKVQTTEVMINANRNIEDYAVWGVPVYPDLQPDYAGPLSGFAVGLMHSRSDYVLTLPCDTPFFPLDLADRLWAQLERDDADIAMAMQAGQTQPVFCLIKKSRLSSLLSFLGEGGRKIDKWTAQERTTLVAFDEPTDDPNAFLNANTQNELAALVSLQG